MFDSSGWNLQKSALALAGALAAGAMLLHGCRETPLLECGPFPAPIQTALDAPYELTAPAGYRIEALDHYAVEALVVSARRYSRGREAELSPLDLALAWGPLTVRDALDTIRYTQSGRWYRYRWENSVPPPVGLRDVIDNSANTHILIPPGREDLHEFAERIERGDTVELNGYLVSVTADDNWRWNSSRTRTDSGARSCEVLYLTDARITAPAP